MSKVALESRPALARHVRLQIDSVTGEPVLLYPEGIIELNATAHAVLSRCDGRTTLSELVEVLAREYEATPEELRGDVLDCVAQLHARELLVLAP
ncbi:MAG TPA: pyrroloquinoline quinone biosynthesis peptide chaperone PqqD [Chthoniobacter sp.]|jgi:pyrroloquinoline quinone biosynthesis protein D